MQQQTTRTGNKQNAAASSVGAKALEDNRSKPVVQQYLADNRGGAFVFTDNRESAAAGRPDTTLQRQENNTGLPDRLKEGVENLSGLSMNDVNVHYNSSMPAQVNAHAFAQGNQIHIAPGQEKHLPHEAWHVVQQKQGRVTPTQKLSKNIAINDNNQLEDEATKMGAQALAAGRVFQRAVIRDNTSHVRAEVIQRELRDITEEERLLFHYAKDNAKTLVVNVFNLIGKPGTSMSMLTKDVREILLEVFGPKMGDTQLDVMREVLHNLIRPLGLAWMWDIKIRTPENEGFLGGLVAGSIPAEHYGLPKHGGPRSMTLAEGLMHYTDNDIYNEAPRGLTAKSGLEGLEEALSDPETRARYWARMQGIWEEKMRELTLTIIHEFTHRISGTLDWQYRGGSEREYDRFKKTGIGDGDEDATREQLRLVWKLRLAGYYKGRGKTAKGYADYKAYKQSLENRNDVEELNTGTITALKNAYSALRNDATYYFKKWHRHVSAKIKEQDLPLAKQDERTMFFANEENADELENIHRQVIENHLTGGHLAGTRKEVSMLAGALADKLKAVPGFNQLMIAYRNVEDALESYFGSRPGDPLYPEYQVLVAEKNLAYQQVTRRSSQLRAGYVRMEHLDRTYSADKALGKLKEEIEKILRLLDARPDDGLAALLRKEKLTDAELVELEGFCHKLLAERKDRTVALHSEKSEFHRKRVATALPRDIAQTLEDPDVRYRNPSDYMVRNADSYNYLFTLLDKGKHLATLQEAVPAAPTVASIRQKR